jgi:probable HAF family extracellular repeat protein
MNMTIVLAASRFAAALLFVLGVSIANATTYVATPIGAPGDLSSQARAMNAFGQVTGIWYPTNNTVTSFLYDRGSMFDIGGNGAASYSGNAINGLGQVLMTSSLSGGAPLLYSAGVATNLSALTGGRLRTATGINDTGAIVGLGRLTPNSPNRAMLYANGILTDLGTISGSGSSTAIAINNSGMITGASSNASLGRFDAFLYNGTQMIDLDPNGVGLTSVGQAINNLSEVAGYVDVSTSSGFVRHAFKYSGGFMKDIGTLGGKESFAYGINDSGTVVGYALNAGGDQRGFVYSNGTMVDLNSVAFDIHGNHIPKITDAFGINNAGQIIANVGNVVFPRGYLLTPVPIPEPSSLLLILFGISALSLQLLRPSIVELLKGH